MSIYFKALIRPMPSQMAAGKMSPQMRSRGLWVNLFTLVLSRWFVRLANIGVRSPYRLVSGQEQSCQKNVSKR